jgi:hypothetical protein
MYTLILSERQKYRVLQLNRARAANLNQRVEAAVRAAGA